jgi:hypothetical protein
MQTAVQLVVYLWSRDTQQMVTLLFDKRPKSPYMTLRLLLHFSMKDYVDKVKEHVVGQGVVTEIDGADFFPPPPSDEMLQQLEDQLAHKATIGSSGK